MRASTSEDASRLRFLEGWAAEAGTAVGPSVIEDALAVADPLLGGIIDEVVRQVGRRRFRASPATSHFDALCRSIVYQQLSKKAAATIYGRFLVALNGEPCPDLVLRTATRDLRAAGLSARKVRYVRELATAVEGGLLDLDALDLAADAEVVDSLTTVPGIGAWTAQMFLMFRLRRLDVLPLNDVGILRGLQIAHGLRRSPAPGYLARVGRRWQPHRSIACLYLWAAVDLNLSPPARPAGKRGYSGRLEP